MALKFPPEKKKGDSTPLTSPQINFNAPLPQTNLKINQTSSLLISKPARKKSAIQPINVLSQRVKRLMFGHAIDQRLGQTVAGQYDGGFEEGLTILFGPYGGGKSTICLQLTMIALKQGLTVKYFDIENSIRRPRILQLYETMGRPFPAERLQNVFYQLKEWTFAELYKEWMYTIQVEKPDLFIVDPLSPVMIGDFLMDKYEKKGGKGYEIWGRRYTLATQTQKLCVENKTIAIVTGHESSSMAGQEENKLAVKDIIEFNLGAPFAHQAKMHLWLGYFSDSSGKVFRGMVLLKHRFIKSELNIHNVSMDDIIRYQITNRGIEPI